MLILDSGSLKLTTDEDSKISPSIDEDKNLPLVHETVAVTPVERDERVASPHETSENVSSKIYLKLIQWLIIILIRRREEERTKYKSLVTIDIWTEKFCVRHNYQ